MFLVTLTRDMRPHHAGAEILVTDEVAERLVASGEAKDPRPHPAPPPGVRSRRSYKIK